MLYNTLKVLRNPLWGKHRNAIIRIMMIDLRNLIRVLPCGQLMSGE